MANKQAGDSQVARLKIAFAAVQYKFHSYRSDKQHQCRGAVVGMVYDGVLNIPQASNE